mgnify:CR=1 FL=1
MHQQPTPVILALESLSDVFDAIGVDRLSSPLQSTRYRLHRSLARTGSVPDEEICIDFADSLSDVLNEARLMTEDPFSQAGVRLTSGGAP